MKVRNCLYKAVIPLCIVSLLSFIFVFIGGIVITNNLNEYVINKLPLTEKNIAQWSEIPGSLGYSYIKQYTLFNIENLDASTSTIELSSMQPANYSLNRTFTDIDFDQETWLINHYLDFNYTVLTEDGLNTARQE